MTSSTRPAAMRRVHLLRHRLQRLGKARLLLAGYLTYILLGVVLLSLPAAQTVPVGLLDNLFTATSAVSTTGLVTVDPGSSYTRFGEIVVLLLIQLGGLGYMTLSSFLVVAIRHRLSRGRQGTVRAAFDLPPEIELKSFLMAVVLFTLTIEVAGAAALYLAFTDIPPAERLWSAIFHSVSAFCTAGFSLNPDSLESYRASVPVNLVIAALSLLGAMGFVVVNDVARTLTGRERRLGGMSIVIVRMTAALIAGGTLIVVFADGTLAALPFGERLMAAFFQVMTASTTVGFDTVPISSMALVTILVLLAMMLVGASPAGTGGGVKTTNLAALWGLVSAVLRGYDTVVSFGRHVPPDRLRIAMATFVFYFVLLFWSVLVLTVSETGQSFERLLFEAMSAIGTVGLSLGLTGELTPIGKSVVILLMIAGRVGILTFGLALASGAGRSRADTARAVSA